MQLIEISEDQNTIILNDDSNNNKKIELKFKSSNRKWTTVCKTCWFNQNGWGCDDIPCSPYSEDNVNIRKDKNKGVFIEINKEK